MGGVYAMENKDIKTDYQEVFRVGEQKSEMVEITIGIIFLFVWGSYSIFFIYVWNFQFPPEKNYPHLKCRFAPKIPIWRKSLLFKSSEKWLNPPSLTPGRKGGAGGGGGCELWNPSEYVTVYISL